MVLPFQYPEDERFFTGRLCRPGESIEDYSAFFDFGDPGSKRRDYQRIRDAVLADYVDRYGVVCHLRRGQVACSPRDGLEIDHVIPLQANYLNKTLRHLAPPSGRKVPQQSFGSNNRVNLVLACTKCNGNKKNSLPTRAEFRAILDRRDGIKP